MPGHTTTTERTCPPPPAEKLPHDIPVADATASSVAVSRAAFSCADTVVLASPRDLTTVALAAQLAAAVGGPLLLGEDPLPGLLTAELARLDPRRILVVGATLHPPTGDSVRVETLSSSPDALAARIATALGTSRRTTIPGVPSVWTLAGAVLAMSGGNAVAAPPPGAPVDAAAAPELEATPTVVDAADTVAALATPRREVWLLDARSPLAALPAAAAATARGGETLLVDGSDLRRAPGVAAAVRHTRSALVLVASSGPATSDQLDTLLHASQLPGGGFLLFPGRRLVAFYGNPKTRSLGVLGEQGPQATVDRLLTAAQPYGADGLQVLPAFEIIATVASATPGANHDYSQETSVAVLRPWVETATADGVYVVLDLQPGRTDFLTQARRYQELLSLPNVGLALDPEWRLGPNDVHGRHTGSVGAAEVNQVVDWLAGLVREHHLPQKLLVLHEYKTAMITGRDQIHHPPELAMVVQMDGQGPLPTKYTSYARVTAGADSTSWWWGWKSFYDEDHPMATPEQVLALHPLPVYVSFQ